MKEAAIQGAIVEYLDAVLTSAHRCFAVPNASRRTKSGRASNAVPGLRKGVPDLQIVGRGKVYFVEVKTARGTPSDEQEEWLAWCTVNSTPWCIARSVDDVRVALNHWGIPTREAKALPPTIGAE
ncbi:VRR-NUC domain-containing protein [Hyphomicrobium sp.]|uniref:VRR-NUC domain-containing protein n=1 Tax=Hyphomicrobium sp. TaxID=82 RepID=UPI0035679E07